MTRPPVCVVCGRACSDPDRWFDHLWTCRDCGLVFADLAAYPETDGFYGEEYFKGEEYRDYASERGIIEKNLRRHLDVISGYAPAGRLFEVGCAYGFFLALARRRWTASGIDVSREAVRYAREVVGVEAVAGEFLDHPLEPESVDVFCLWDTIEHLRRPDLYVDRMARCLRPGGVVCLTTGDIGSLNARLRGRSWRLIHPPTHLYYFSVGSLRRLFERFGMKLVHLSHAGYSRSLRTMFHQMAIARRPGPARSILAGLEASPLGSIDVYLNLLDIRLAVARKESR